MLKSDATPTLSRILAVRMAAASVVVLLALTFLSFLHDISNFQQLQEATLNNNANAIASALAAGRDPAKLHLYQDFPQAYGFRVFDRRALLARRVLSSANTRWLPPVQHPVSTPSDPDRDRDRTAAGADLAEGFTLVNGSERGERAKSPAALLIRRVAADNHHYWVQTYMRGDPGFAVAEVLVDNLRSHVLIPALFFIPTLTLAIFLTTRAVLRPLRELSESAIQISAAVARGQALTPVTEEGMAKEFADVAATINTIMEKLDHSLQVQKQFTSDIAHELRTPLAVLLLETSQLPPGEGRERVKSDLKDLGDRVNEMLRFAQAEDVMAREARDTDIAAIARKVVEDSVPEALAKHQSLEFEVTATPTVVRGNAALLEIAIRNLVHNATKYSPAYASIAVSVGAGPTVIVEDSGPGIAAELRERVFERFWRIDRQSGGGAGVGLALVRRIVELHGGAVRLENRHGGGTRMILGFAPASASPRPPKDSMIQQASSRKERRLSMLS